MAGSDIVTKNGRAYAEGIAQGYREKGYTANVKNGSIPTWGGGGTESGHRVEISGGKPRQKIIK